MLVIWLYLVCKNSYLICKFLWKAWLFLVCGCNFFFSKVYTNPVYPSVPNTLRTKFQKKGRGRGKAGFLFALIKVWHPSIGTYLFPKPDPIEIPFSCDYISDPATPALHQAHTSVLTDQSVITWAAGISWLAGWPTLLLCCASKPTKLSCWVGLFLPVVAYTQQI